MKFAPTPWLCFGLFICAILAGMQLVWLTNPPNPTPSWWTFGMALGFSLFYVVLICLKKGGQK